MSDDIDALAGTRRRAIVAKALRQRHPDRAFTFLVGDAREVLDALDEDYDGGPYEMTVEQEIRAKALDIAARLFDAEVSQVLANAAVFAAWITDGSQSGRTLGELHDALTAAARTMTAPISRYAAEPTPPLDGDGAAAGHGGTEGSGT